MSDQEKLKALLTEFGVGFTEDETSISCEAGDAKVGGYIGFGTTFEFDTEGKFKRMGAWES
ncbi:hypothetical protein ACEP28_32440 [Pseudomonas aeruginosa]